MTEKSALAGRHPAAYAQLTRRVCGLAALLTLALILASHTVAGGMDWALLAFALSPYPALALISGGWHKVQVARVIFAITVTLALAGVGLFAWDTILFHVIPEHRMTQRLTVIVVPLLQWAITLAIAAGLLIVGWLGKRG